MRRPGGRPERLTTTEPRDRFLEPPQASRLRHGVEATALPHRGPPIQPRARARAKRDRHMQPVRQDHHPGGPQALNNHLEPKARQCATRDVVGATGGGLGGEVAGKPAARLLGPSARKARTNDRGSRAPTAPTWAVAHRSCLPDGLGRVQPGHGRPHPLPAPRDPGAQHAGCGLCMPCKASGMRCKAGARGSTATMGQYPSLRRESGRAAPAANVSGLLPDLSTRPSAAQLPRNPLPDLWDGHGSNGAARDRECSAPRRRCSVVRGQTPALRISRLKRAGGSPSPFMRGRTCFPA